MTGGKSEISCLTFEGVLCWHLPENLEDTSLGYLRHLTSHKILHYHRSTAPPSVCLKGTHLYDIPGVCIFDVDI